MNNENNNVVPTPHENNGINISPMPNVDNSQTVQPVPNVFTNQPAQPVNDISVQPVNNVESVQPVENVVPVQPANEMVSQPTVSESVEQINIGESVNSVPPVQESQVQPIVEQQPIGSQQVLNSEEVKVVDSKPEEPKNDTISQTVQSFYNEPKKKKSKAVPFLVFIIILLCLGIVAMYLYYNGHLDKYIGGSTTNDSVEQKDNSKSDTAVEETELDITSEKVKSLTSVLSIGELQNGGYSDFIKKYYYFDEGKIIASEFSDEFKTILAITNMLNDKVIPYCQSEKTQITQDKMNEYINQIFGAGFKYNTVSYKLGNTDIFTYDANTKTYSVISGPCHGLGFSIPYIDSTIVKAVETNDTIDLYMRMAYVTYKFDEGDNTDSQAYDLLYHEKMDETSKVLATIDKTGKFTQDSKLDKLHQYKYSFKKNNNGNYYFDSVEKVK